MEFAYTKYKIIYLEVLNDILMVKRDNRRTIKETNRQDRANQYATHAVVIKGTPQIP